MHLRRKNVSSYQIVTIVVTIATIIETCNRGVRFGAQNHHTFSPILHALSSICVFTDIILFIDDLAASIAQILQFAKRRVLLSRFHGLVAANQAIIAIDLG